MIPDFGPGMMVLFDAVGGGVSGKSCGVFE
jgi:hypothetical protein